eukprot:4040322-Prymnesium_polylepis.1
MLCNDVLHEEYQQHGSTDFVFQQYDPIKVKGYNNPVTFYQPKPNIKRSVVNDVLRRMEIFSCLGPNEQELLRLAMRDEQFQEGDRIIQEGEEGDTFYIIITGTVEVTKEVPGSSTPERITKFSDGDYFGELALINSEPRTATVSAMSEIQAMSIDRDSFSRLLGPLQDILRRHARRYSQIEAHQTDGTAMQAATESLDRKEEVGFLLKRVECVMHTSEMSITLITGEPTIGKSHTL